VAVSPKHNAVLLQFLHQFKACTLPFSSRCYLKPHCLYAFLGDHDHSVEFSEIMLAWNDENANY